MLVLLSLEVDRLPEFLLPDLLLLPLSFNLRLCLAGDGMILKTKQYFNLSCNSDYETRANTGIHSFFLMRYFSFCAHSFEI